MTDLPSPSPGVLAHPLGDRAVLYDLVTEVVHVLNAPAALVWDACVARVALAALTDAIVAATDADPGQVRTDVEAGVDQLRASGLVGRTVDPPRPAPMAGATAPGRSHGAVHAVLDEGVRFHADDPSLLAAVDELLGLDDQRATTIDLLIDEADGTVRLEGWGEPRTYRSRERFLSSLPTALNHIAATSSSCLALHAGAVRSPDGEVVLLPAASGSGKTTLTAALVQAGWDYATDEAVGVREGTLVAVAYPKPLVLSSRSRDALSLGPGGPPNTAPSDLRSDVQVLRGEIGRVTRVVLPRYEAGAATSVTRLTSAEAVVGILEHALNLARVGPAGLAAICQLAEQVPVHQLLHGGKAAAVATVTELVAESRVI